ncbi:RNA polymerase sigma factor [Pedobacter alluvionis]|uniref:RNA polymerase sigma factor n=1 Tax=Pedobacter alluvionis TaxID=475253 RepID=A0A497Y0A0_9SPHI|nr:RNA polymerase sigma-70 factor [Pedobacter alluvionis]RLJ75139.1 RNA polymerase sigma-70 factor (ECF subfamily) [Pedobacter alluvionis]TFB30243.1 RNA polymerase sigma-70 factor [Pedobacter alluvionis]
MRSFPLTDEKDLLLRLQKGDQYAFEQLYRMYSKRIFINTVKLVKDEDEAQEILQDVFIRIWNKRENIDTEKPFSSYLFSIAQNLIRDFFRKAALDRKMQAAVIAQSTELYEHIESSIYFKESSALLQNAIDALPLQRKKIYTLCKVEGKSYKEVAEILGISASTVDNQLVKATQSVRSYFHASKTYIALLTILMTATI